MTICVDINKTQERTCVDLKGGSIGKHTVNSYCWPKGVLCCWFLILVTSYKNLRVELEDLTPKENFYLRNGFRRSHESRALRSRTLPEISYLETGQPRNTQFG